MADHDLLLRVAVLNDLQSGILEPLLKRRGYRWSTFQLLSTLLPHPRGLVQAEVARRLEITPPTLTEAVKNHVEAGLIEQKDDRRDKRAKRIILTASGKAAIRAMLKDTTSLEGAMVKGIGDTELRITAMTLDKMQENLEKLVSG